MLDHLRSSSTDREQLKVLADVPARIAEIGRIVSSALSIDEVFAEFSEQARNLVSFDRLVISTLSEDGTELVDRFISGVKIEGSAPGSRLPVEYGELYEHIFVQKRQLVATGQELEGLEEFSPTEAARLKAGLKSLLITPLVWQGAVIGALNFRSFDPEAFRNREIELAQQIANQIAGAVATADQYAIMERQSQEREHLAEIGRIVSSSPDLKDVVADFAKHARALLRADRLTIWDFSKELSEFTLLHVDGLHIEEPIVDPRHPQVAEEVYEQAVRQQLHFVASGKELEEFKRGKPDEEARYAAGLRAVLITPLIWQGAFVGGLGFRSFDPNAFGEREIGLAWQVSRQIAGAFASASQYKALQRESLDRERIAEIGRVISSSLDLGEVLKSFAEQARELVPFDRIVITVANKNLTEVTDLLVDGIMVGDGTAGDSYLIAENALQHRVIVEQDLLVANRNEYAALAAKVPAEKSCIDAGLNSALLVPLVWQGRCIGSLNFRSLSALAYGKREVELAKQVGAQIAGAIAAANQYRQLEDAVSELRTQAAALEAADDAVIILNLDTSIEYVNEAFVKNTGYSKEEVIGKKAPAIPSPGDSSELYDGMWEQLRMGKAWRAIHSSLRKDGTEYQVESSVTPVFGEDGSIVGYIGIRRDITERLQAERDRDARRQLDAQNKQLQEINRQRNEFFSTVSHELRTPLTAVLAFADILSRNTDGALSDVHLEQLDVIKRNSRRLNDLVEDMLDISRLNADSLRLEKTEFEIHAFTDSVIESLEPTARQRNQVLRAVAHVSPIWITADHGRITQVLSNLITNSCKYSASSTSITLKIEQQDDWVIIMVEDEGFGISPEDLCNIFSPFFRSDRKEIRNENGTGLGLAISKTLVELHGGIIEATSRLGEGTRMRVMLPGASNAPTGMRTGSGEAA